MDTPKRVLIVEDDAHIAELLRMHLHDEGYAVTHAADGHAGMRELERGQWDALVLDLMLPGVDGLEICRKARSMTRYTPIIITSARSSEVHRILGLELGADDYLAKPFSVLELVARVRALLRRSSGQLGERRIELGDLRIDPARRVVERDGATVPLTTLEFDLLYFLAARPGRVFSREALMEHVWGTERVVDERSIDSLVSRLRRKLERDPAAPSYLQTVWGAGYRLMAPA